MRYLTKTDILEAEDLRSEDVEVPEWGGKVRVFELTGTDRDAYQASIIKQREDGTREWRLANATVRLVSMSIGDPDTHERLFTEGDVTALGKKSARALNRVFTVAQRLSALADEDVEELLGN
jgi:hypothetical protein